MVTFPFCMAGLFVDLTPGPGSSTAGAEYSITCTVAVIGLITPSITWRAPGDIVISTDTSFTVGAVTGSGPTYSSVLMFNSLNTSQAGEYTCTAEVHSVTEMSSTVISVTSMSSAVSYQIMVILGWGQFQQLSVSQVCLCTVVQFPTRQWESVGPTQFKCLQYSQGHCEWTYNTESLLVYGFFEHILGIPKITSLCIWSISSNNALAHYVPLSLL